MTVSRNVVVKMHGGPTDRLRLDGPLVIEIPSTEERGLLL